MTTTIPVVAVEIALFSAARLGKRNIAAFTNDPRFSSTCEQVKRHGLPPEPAEPAHVGALSHGSLLKIAQKTQLIQGTSEVRRTWGCGIRQLQAELAPAR